ncbi:MAG TPA: hypothetical protein VK082_06010 [Paenalcaligenes sp.]|nr:hypothetical protein [Paenalcaligenes sp.]
MNQKQILDTFKAMGLPLKDRGIQEITESKKALIAEYYGIRNKENYKTITSGGTRYSRRVLQH